MSQSPNQFGQTNEKGLIDTKIGGTVLSCKVAVGALVAGQPCKIVDSYSGVPEVQPITAQSDIVFGFVVRDYKKSSYAIGEMIEVACFNGGIMHMEASEAIAKGGQVSCVISGEKVESADSTEMIIGVALDKAAASGDLIRVYINLPGSIKP